MANVDFDDPKTLKENKRKYAAFEDSGTSEPQKWESLANDEDELINILDPNDPLMSRFQASLKSHLERINAKLSDSVNQLDIAVKDANKTREDEAVSLYDLQQEARRQETSVDGYKDMLAEIVNLRASLEGRLEGSRVAHKAASEKLKAKKLTARNLVRTVESLESLRQQVSKWEKELLDNATVSLRISEKDGALGRNLLYQKQQRDYVLLKLEDQVWRLRSEIKESEDQLQIKDGEKLALGQAIADASVDLEGLEREQKAMYNAWNGVLNLVSQRDRIHEEIASEQSIYKSRRPNLKKTRTKRWKITSVSPLHARIGEEINATRKHRESDKGRHFNLEIQFFKSSKLLEQNERELGAALLAYESTVENEKISSKEFLRLGDEKRRLEDDVLTKFNDKINHDKAIRQSNKLLHEVKDSNMGKELNLARFENLYAKSLLELELRNSDLANGKFDLDVVGQRNADKGKKIETLRAEVKSCEALFGQRERKIVILNKRVEEMLKSCSGREVNPLDAKIASMERSVAEADGKIKEAQRCWLRRQGDTLSLSRQKDAQSQELNATAKEIILMEQRNVKLDAELERQRGEEASLNKAIDALRQKLVKFNLRLASQKRFKQQLEGRNCAAKSEYVESLEDAELDLIKSEADIRRSNDEKSFVEDELKCAQQTCLSWEKKVQLANETNRSYKEERNAGGDVAVMKSEIHKMEIRLSYLRRAQEKLLFDMECCISRRDNIIDEALAREKKNPKNQHNQRIIMKKRLEDQKTKIRQVLKEIKQIESKIEIVYAEQKKLLEYSSAGQKLLRQNEDVVPDVEKQMAETELIKHHNLELLVRKQRKVNMLRDLKNGQYKSLIKSEAILREEWRNQRDVNKKLNEIMQQTKRDFPLLKNQIQKISLTLSN